MMIYMQQDYRLTDSWLHMQSILTLYTDWREVRYLYRYSEAELTKWRERIYQLAQHSKQVMIIFNNNSGGDALHNAKQFMQLLGQETIPLPPQQMDLF